MLETENHIAQPDLENRAVFETVFKSNYDYMCRFAFQYVKDIDQAEEVVQEVFFKLWEKRTSVKIKESIQSYLLRSVKNHCLNHIKHLSVRQQHHDFVKHHNSENDTVHQQLEASELEVKINNVILQLPKKCREVFLLSRYEDLKYKEIAEQLNISIKTVENQIGKALKIMREGLGDYLPNIIPWIILFKMGIGVFIV